MLTKEGVFGFPQCWLYSIEWQKHVLDTCGETRNVVGGGETRNVVYKEAL